MADGFTLEFTRRHPRDTAALLNRLDTDDIARFLDQVPGPEAAAIIKGLLAQKAARCLALMRYEHAARLLAILPADYAAMLLRRLDLSRRHLILNTLPAGLAAALRITLRFPNEVVGSIMDPDVPVVYQNMTVSDALDIVRAAGTRMSNTLIVVDGNNYLAGIVEVRQLLSAQPATRMVDLQTTTPVHFSARLGIGGLMEHSAWHALDAVPVIDHRNMVLGVLRREALATAVLDVAADQPENNSVSALAFDFADIFWSACAGLFAPDKDDRAGRKR